MKIESERTAKPVVKVSSYVVSSPIPAMMGWYCLVLADNVPIQKFTGYKTAEAAIKAAKAWIKRAVVEALR